MKPFHFSLELLRVLRQQKEQAAQQRYVAALAASEAAERELQTAAGEMAGAWGVLNQELRQGLTASRLAGLRAWCQVLEIRWNERKAAREEARSAAGVAFEAMRAAARDREALDRFYDKSRLAYDREVQREEQKNLDELAVQLNSAPGPLQFSGRQN